MSITFTLTGPMQSGKNRVLITRTGHRYPPERFKVWRDTHVAAIRRQCDGFPQPIRHRIALIVDYTPGDLRTRDVAGMLDAICHLLERSGLIEHDGLIRDCTWHEFPMDRTKPQATVTLRTLEVP
jgi:Holliday junction resolvase RusA-like endonuclease